MEIRRADTIAEQLQEMVFTGHFSDGDRLDEIRLAEQFGVSRTPIREALQKLVVSGLAEQLPRRGVFIKHPGPIELIEMFDVMAEFEAMCGRLAAQRISDEALLQLQSANNKCQTAVDQGDIDTYYNENEIFHQIIYRQSGNSFLEEQAKLLQKRLKPFRRVQLRFRGRMAQSMAEHKSVVQALTDGNSDIAASTLRGHVAVQGEKFHNLMASLKPAAE